VPTAMLVVGDATWGKWSLDRTSVMIRDNSNENLLQIHRMAQS